MKRLLVVFFVIPVVVCCTRPAPRIGVSCYSSGDVPARYTESVAMAGADVSVIPVLKTREEADAVVAGLDGILFSGGEDLNPLWYGEEILNETVEIDPVRDLSDSLLARAVLESGKPVLAICRGEQLMNIMLGGSLYQDIPSQVAEPVQHSESVHKIGIEPGSVLAALYGTDSLLVNSFHHQAVKVPAPGIRITARSADGLVEAYEADNIIALQFHPEKLLVDEGEQQWLELFRYFIDRCRK